MKIPTLTPEQRGRVDVLRAVYGDDPQDVGTVDGTEDDFGDLLSEVAVALGHDPEADDAAWQRLQAAGTYCDTPDLLEWAAVLHGAWLDEAEITDPLRALGMIAERS